MTKLVDAASPQHGQEWPFEVMNLEQFEELSAVELQKQFKRKHLVVRGMRVRKMKFDRRGLESLGNWEQRRHVQGRTLPPSILISFI